MIEALKSGIFRSAVVHAGLGTDFLLGVDPGIYRHEGAKKMIEVLSAVGAIGLFFVIGSLIIIILWELWK